MSSLSIILGGGEGKRLYPLTRYRSKPAVPIAGKYRLIDIPVSNCIHSGIERIFVLTQFNSASLNRHINLAYKFDAFHEGFVTILAAEQTMDSLDWFQGTADAVRKTFRHFQRYEAEDYLILAGDHIYQMDYRLMQATHQSTGADLTLAVSPVSLSEVGDLGVLKVEPDGRISDFLEKPRAGTDLSAYYLPDKLRAEYNLASGDPLLLGSMGVYLFRHEALKTALQDHAMTDFGRHIIPAAVHEMRVQAHLFSGYWRDVGTIASFFQANMDLLNEHPAFRLFRESFKIFTHSRYLAGSRIGNVSAQQAVLNEGCIVHEATLKRALIGVRTVIGRGVTIEDSYVMGADFYEGDPEAAHNRPEGSGVPPLGIGDDSRICGAIVDKNARIGKGVNITRKNPGENYAGHGYMVRDGITVVEKDAVIPDGAVV